MKEIPAELRNRPFTREEAQAHGISSRMLQGRRFVQVFPRVWRATSHPMSDHDWLVAARMTLPAHARLTGLTRIQELGLDFGPRWPLRFVVEGDLHLVPSGIFLHRTKSLPPCDDQDVTPAAAFVAFCRQSNVLNAIKVGDWLLARKAMTVEDLVTFAVAEPWRDGSAEALWVSHHLDGRSRSLPESETRAVLSFAGLPAPSVNTRIPLAEDLVLIGDLLYEEFRAVVEYEGAHHQEERDQYVADVDRYSILRRSDVAYVQVTKERLRQRRTVVGEVFRMLVERGYTGPEPVFGDRWRQLDVRLSALAPSHLARRSAVG